MKPGRVILTGSVCAFHGSVLSPACSVEPNCDLRLIAFFFVRNICIGIFISDNVVGKRGHKVVGAVAAAAVLSAS